MPKLTAVRLCAGRCAVVGSGIGDSRRVSVDGGGFAGRRYCVGLVTGEADRPLTRRRRRPELRVVPDGELLHHRGQDGRLPHLQRQLVVIAR